MSDFIEDRITDPTTAGKVTVVRDGRTFGTFDFGTGTAAGHYPRWSTGETGGRTFRMAWGIRF